ncbi:MAG: trypsin-like serine protease [Verrucomicrobiae bacterium]|nr:trypsin-like serine protease [Verrucomicrobiae bacterium]
MNPRHLGPALALIAFHLPAAAADTFFPLPTAPLASLIPSPPGTLASQATLAHVIQAGHPAPHPLSGILPDNPTLRIDPNTTTSPFAGVGSLFANDDPSTPFGVLCTATPISSWQVLTAAHCLDIVDGDGRSDVRPENALFILNYGSDFSHIIPAASITLHPDYNGYSGLGVSDDLAILHLTSPLPPGVPIYPLADPNWLSVAPVILVGYGDSGDGVNGYSVGSQFSIKRVGVNLIEYAELDDDGGPEVEIIAWDFEYEGDPGRYDLFGIPFAFPNRLETTLGSGDSGGPAFMLNPYDPSDPQLYLAGVNTFSFWFEGVPNHDQPGRFGSGSGGIWLNAEYQAWITSVPETSTWLAGGALLSLFLLTRRRPASR